MNRVAVRRDHFLGGLVAFAVTAFGVIILLWPIHLDTRDESGFVVSCGLAVAPDYQQAVEADAALPTHDANRALHHPDVDNLGRCRSAVLRRRVWSGGLLILGSTGAALAALRRLSGPSSFNDG